LRLMRTVTLFLVLSSIAMLQLGNVDGQMMNHFTFIRTPANYNPETDSFTLNEQAYGGYSGKFCLAYDYFVFDADAGQAMQGQVNSPGQVIGYAFINSYQLYVFDAYAQNCYLYLNSVQYFSSQAALNWTPPANGQYALIFFTRTYYTGSVYFTLSPAAI